MEASLKKVLHGLYLCRYDPDPGDQPKEQRSCAICPYFIDGEKRCSDMLLDASWLLQEQQKDLEDLRKQLPKYYNTATWVFDRPHHWYCSNCGTMQGLTARIMSYCPHCGYRMTGGEF